KGTVVAYVRPADDGSLGFAGYYNSRSGVGRLNSDGSLRWFQQTTYEASNVVSLPATGIVPRGLVVVGRQDTDGDGQIEIGYASLYSYSGNLLSQLLVSSDSSDIWTDGLVPVDDSTFIACGGERRSGVKRPSIFLLHLKAPGVLELGKTVTFPGLIDEFDYVVTLPSTPAELVLAATSYDHGAIIHALRVPWPGLDPVTVAWNREIIVTSGPVAGLYDLAQAGGNLYVVGTVDDTTNHPLPSNGGAWDTGLAASYTASRDQRWLTIVPLTKHS